MNEKQVRQLDRLGLSPGDSIVNTYDESSGTLRKVATRVVRCGVDVLQQSSTPLGENVGNQDHLRSSARRYPVAS